MKKKWNEEEIEEMNKKKKWKKLIGNRIGDEGVKSLSETLKINTSLTSLNLGCDENENENEKKKREEMKMKEMNSEQNRKWRSKVTKWNIED